MKEFFKSLWEIFKMAVLAFLIVFPVRYFLFQPFIVNGASMSPSFETSDYLFVDELSFRLRDVERGEVIVFRAPLQPTDRYIKRVIGLPGETIEIREGIIYISKGENKFVLNESGYLSEKTITSGEINVSLKENEYFVMGDNRQFSSDSRSWGYLPEENIIGRAFFRLLPVDAILVISRPVYGLSE